jgi:hypothetical protein
MKIIYLLLSVGLLYSCSDESNKGGNSEPQFEIIEGVFSLNIENQELISDSNLVVDFDQYLDTLRIGKYCNMMNDLSTALGDSSDLGDFEESHADAPFSNLPCRGTGTVLRYKLLDQYDLFGEPVIESFSDRSLSLISLSTDQLNKINSELDRGQRLKLKVLKVGQQECNMMGNKIYTLIETVE